VSDLDRDVRVIGSQGRIELNDYTDSTFLVEGDRNLMVTVPVGSLRIPANPMPPAAAGRRLPAVRGASWRGTNATAPLWPSPKRCEPPNPSPPAPPIGGPELRSRRSVVM
jgi:hypothetical protein